MFLIPGLRTEPTDVYFFFFKALTILLVFRRKIPEQAVNLSSYQEAENGEEKTEKNMLFKQAGKPGTSEEEH